MQEAAGAAKWNSEVNHWHLVDHRYSMEVGKTTGCVQLVVFAKLYSQKITVKKVFIFVFLKIASSPPFFTSDKCSVSFIVLFRTENTFSTSQSVKKIPFLIPSDNMRNESPSSSA